MAKQPVFKDLNFKLAVIEQLMYQQQVLQPAFDVRTFIGPEKWAKVDREKHSFKAVPGVKKYFRDLVISAELLEKVTIIDQNYHTAYHQVTPFWDGEGDEFNITSIEDLALVPNLREAILLYESSGKMLEAFQEAGINTRYL